MNKQAKRTIRITDKAVCLDLQFHRLGDERKLNTSEMLSSIGDGERAKRVDPRRIKAQKKLFESAEYDTIKSFESVIRQYVVAHSLPSLFRRGMYLVPHAFIDRVEKKLAEFREERNGMVSAFVEAYPEMLKSAGDGIEPLFDPSEYPSVDVVANSFGMSWHWIALEVPQSLQSISKELFEKEKQRAEKQWREAGEELQKLMRASMAKFVAHMTDKLSDAPEGKRKVLTNAATDKFKEFLKTFEARNITEDAELAALVKKAKRLLTGVDADIIKDSEEIKEQVKQGFEAIASELSEMVEDAPTRAITLGDEDV